MLRFESAPGQWGKWIVMPTGGGGGRDDKLFDLQSQLVFLGNLVKNNQPLPVANGGTGQSTYTNGQLLIGNASGGLSKATLTAGANVTISNGNGTITIAATGGGGGGGGVSQGDAIAYAIALG